MGWLSGPEERAFRIRIKADRWSDWRDSVFYDYDGRTADEVAEILADMYPDAISIQVYP